MAGPPTEKENAKGKGDLGGMMAIVLSVWVLLPLLSPFILIADPRCGAMSQAGQLKFTPGNLNQYSNLVLAYRTPGCSVISLILGTTLPSLQ